MRTDGSWIGSHILSTISLHANSTSPIVHFPHLSDRNSRQRLDGARSSIQIVAATAFQHMHDAADETSIVRPLDTSHICWQTPLATRVHSIRSCQRFAVSIH